MGPAGGILLGALVGATVSGGAAFIAGKSGTEVLAAASGGAVDGGISVCAAFIGNPTLAYFLIGASGGIGNYVEQQINIVFGNQENVNLLDLGVSAATGAVVNVGSEFIEDHAKSVIKDVINSESTVKSLEKEIMVSSKSAGRKLKPFEVKKSVKAKIHEMKEAVDKALQVFFEAITNSFGFYNEIDEDEK